ncbi:MAG TPA: alanine racemase C-terminal domain-containing protein [Homoserinimonas sp.]|nr:alanine racemase C-terminal domain-containing protein [Homoserinimonas sp.]
MSFSARTLHLSAHQFDLLDSGMVDDEIVANLLQSLPMSPPRLEAEVLATKRVGAGAGVSYGHTYRTSTTSTLALVAIGYGHGIPRKAGNRASVTWGGQRMPIVGRVAMDVLVVDAGDATVTAGETVVFFGDPASAELSLAEWSQSVGEHPFSLLACLDDRVSRVVAQ